MQYVSNHVLLPYIDNDLPYNPASAVVRHGEQPSSSLLLHVKILNNCSGSSYEDTLG